MLHLVLIILAVWCALALAAVPLMMLLGRAGRKADDDALRQHEGLVDAAVAADEAAREAARQPVRRFARSGRA